MDYVLGVADNLFFDAIYATLLPTGSLASWAGANDTWKGEYINPLPIVNDPISQFLGLRPSPRAYESFFQRGDWQRQAFSLFLITW